MTKISNEEFFKTPYGVEFTKVKIIKYGKRFNAEFFARLHGVKSEVGIAGESIQNCLDKTELFLETKLRTEEFEVCIKGGK